MIWSSVLSSTSRPRVFEFVMCFAFDHSNGRVSPFSVLLIALHIKPYLQMTSSEKKKAGIDIIYDCLSAKDKAGHPIISPELKYLGLRDMLTDPTDDACFNHMGIERINYVNVTALVEQLQKTLASDISATCSASRRYPGYLRLDVVIIKKEKKMNQPAMSSLDLNQYK